MPFKKSILENNTMISHELQQALKRPKNYHTLSPSEQWEIDKSLGILDWEPTVADRAEYQKIMRRQKTKK